MKDSFWNYALLALEDRRLMDLLELFNERYVLYDEFKRLPLPQSLSASEAWRMVTLLRYHAGTKLPVVPYFSMSGKDIAWINLPRSSRESLGEVSVLASPYSNIAVALSEREGDAYFRNWLILPEAISAAKRDGIDIDAGAAKAALSGSCERSSEGQAVLMAFFELLGDEGIFEQRSITKSLIKELHERLIGLVSPFLLELEPQRRGSKPISGMIYTEDEALGVICDLLDERNAFRWYHPIIAWMTSTSMFWDVRPLPCLNALTELLVRRAYMRCVGLPVLAYVPFSHASRLWEEDGPMACGLRYSYNEGIARPFLIIRIAMVWLTLRRGVIYWVFAPWGICMKRKMGRNSYLLPLRSCSKQSEHC